MTRFALPALVVLTALAAAEEKKPAFSAKVTGKGPPMLLVPGLACSGEVWDETVAHYKDRYTCHVFTLAGFAGQPAVEGPYLDTMRDALVGYIRDKKLERPVLLGHSLGATLVLAVGAAAPAETGPVIAVDGGPCLAALFDEKADAASRQKLRESFGDKKAKLSRADFLSEMEKMFARWIPDEKKMKAVRGWIARSDQATVARALSDVLSADIRGEVGKIRAPVLLIVAYDKAESRMSREDWKKRYAATVATVKDHSVAVTDEAKHFLMYDKPEWFYRQIDEVLARSAGQR